MQLYVAVCNKKYYSLLCVMPGICKYHMQTLNDFEFSLEKKLSYFFSLVRNDWLVHF